MSVTEFATNVFGNRPLHSPAGALPGGGPGRLLDVDDADTLLSARGLRVSSVDLARDGKPANRDSYAVSRTEKADPFVDPDKVFRLLRDGYTVKISGLEKHWPPVMEFTRQLSAELPHPMHVNVFITPPGSRGYDVHYDPYDTFVVQTHGSKNWDIGEPVVVDPLLVHEFHHLPPARRERIRKESKPLMSLTLEAGDTLYVPRGFLHAVSATSTLSIHLSFFIRNVTRLDVATGLLELAADDPWFRRSLGIGQLPEIDGDVPALVSEIAHQITRIARSVDPPELITKLSATLPAAPIRPLRQYLATGRHGAFQLRPGLRVTTSTDETHVSLRTNGGAVRIPRSFEPALKGVLSGQPFTADDLPEPADPSLRVALIDGLIKEGLIIPSEIDHP